VNKSEELGARRSCPCDSDCQALEKRANRGSLRRCSRKILAVPDSKAAEALPDLSGASAVCATSDYPFYDSHLGDPTPCRCSPEPRDRCAPIRFPMELAFPKVALSRQRCRKAPCCHQNYMRQRLRQQDASAEPLTADSTVVTFENVSNYHLAGVPEFDRPVHATNNEGAFGAVGNCEDVEVFVGVEL
jgi:hypothetical protein